MKGSAHLITPLPRWRSISKPSTCVYSTCVIIPRVHLTPNKSPRYALTLNLFCPRFQTLKHSILQPPTDVSRFLVWKDRNGKTVLHVNGCPDAHLGEWNTILGFGNPANSLEVQRYMKAFTEEQLRAHITPKQAVPLFLPKLLLLARFWNKQMAEPSVTPSTLFLLARDQAFFRTLFFSADRGSDLGLVKTSEILHFPQDDGFLFNHIWGKTLKDGASNTFGIRRHQNPELCPVKAIETYVAICSELQIILTEGYLFRPTNPQAGP